MPPIRDLRRLRDIHALSWARHGYFHSVCLSFPPNAICWLSPGMQTQTEGAPMHRNHQLATKIQMRGYPFFRGHMDVRPFNVIGTYLHQGCIERSVLRAKLSVARKVTRIPRVKDSVLS